MFRILCQFRPQSARYACRGYAGSCASLDPKYAVLKADSPIGSGNKLIRCAFLRTGLLPSGANIVLYAVFFF